MRGYPLFILVQQSKMFYNYKIFMYIASQGSLFHVLESSTPFSYLHVWKTLELSPKSHAHGMPKNGLEYSRHFEQFDTLLGLHFWAILVGL